MIDEKYLMIQKANNMAMNNTYIVFLTTDETYTSTPAVQMKYIYAIQAEGTANVVITSAKDLAGTTVPALAGWNIPAGGVLMVNLSEVVITSGKAMVSIADRQDPTSNG